MIHKGHADHTAFGQSDSHRHTQTTHTGDVPSRLTHHHKDTGVAQLCGVVSLYTQGFMRLPSDLKRMEALHSFTFAPWNHNPVQWKNTASLLLPVGYFHFLTESRQAGHDGDKMRSAT